MLSKYLKIFFLNNVYITNTEGNSANMFYVENDALIWEVKNKNRNATFMTFMNLQTRL